MLITGRRRWLNVAPQDAPLIKQVFYKKDGVWHLVSSIHVKVNNVWTPTTISIKTEGAW